MTTHAIKLTSPHELLAVVPYLLGFCPTNSIVTLCLSDNRLGLTQRLDLPPPDCAHDVASALLPILIREGPDSVILIGFEDNDRESLPALEALTTALRSHSMPIHDRLVVREGRWRSLDCNNASCCPPEGRPVRVDPGGAFGAGLTGQGPQPALNEHGVQAVEPVTQRPENPRGAGQQACGLQRGDRQQESRQRYPRGGGEHGFGVGQLAPPGHGPLGVAVGRRWQDRQAHGCALRRVLFPPGGPSCCGCGQCPPDRGDRHPDRVGDRLQRRAAAAAGADVGGHVIAQQ